MFLWHTNGMCTPVMISGADYKTIKNSGLFDSMTLYETCNVFGTDENDKIIERIPGIENVLKGL